MINPTAKDIDRKVRVHWSAGSRANSAGRIVAIRETFVAVDFGDGEAVAYDRGELEWFSGKDREQ